MNGTDTTLQEWRVKYHVETSGVTTNQTVTFGSVEGAIQFPTTIESDNYNATTKTGWRIERSGNAYLNDVTINADISSSTPSTGWEILQDGTANFSNINIDGGTFNVTTEDGIIDIVAQITPYSASTQIFFAQRDDDNDRIMTLNQLWTRWCSKTAVSRHRSWVVTHFTSIPTQAQEALVH